MATIGAMPLMPIDEAAHDAGVSRSTIWRLIRSERLAAYRRTGRRETFVDLEQLGRELGFRRVSGPEPSRQS